jgi:[ribosomal protein S18]-alanine N-acetyltransferase
VKGESPGIASSHRRTFAAGRGLPPGLTARSMRPADIESVVSIENRLYDFPWTRGNFLDSIDSGYECRVVEDGSMAIAGYAVCMWITDEVHLLNLSVSVDRQGRGFGRAILRWLCDCVQLARGSGMLLEVRPSNRVALSLYESEGFVRIGVRKRYYPAPQGLREDAWVMFKRIGGAGETAGE